MTVRGAGKKESEVTACGWADGKAYGVVKAGTEGAAGNCADQLPGSVWESTALIPAPWSLLTCIRYIPYIL